VGKGKLKKFHEITTFSHVIEPEIKGHLAVDHALKGNWNRDYFKNNHPIVVELGCGKGEYTVGLARMYPDKNFIGVDIKGARIWKGAKTSLEEKLTHVAFLRARIELIGAFFGPNEISEIWITFPDPQMKSGRAKKRLTSAGFLTRYQQFLENQGLVHLKTDSKFLYDYTLEVARHNQLEIIRNTRDLYNEHWTDSILSIQTHYERLHIDDGDTINYISFKLNNQQQLKEPVFQNGA
jgi:tRNA (guanine-N7-)-methyltransferase